MKIICAIDGSEYSIWGIETLGSLFHRSIKEVVLLHVMDTNPFKAGLKKEGARASKVKKYVSALEKHGRDLLKRAKDQAELAINQSTTKPFVTIRSVLAKGHAAEVIIREAEKRKPHLIILGSRGMADIQGYLMGSVSRKVLSYAPCAVLMVKEPLLTPAKAVLAVDGSTASKRAANAAKNWLDPEDVSIRVLSVVPQVLTDIAPKVLPKKHLMALTEPFYQRAQELTSQYRTLFIKEGYEVIPEILNGNPREVILESLRKTKAQLAILGSKGLTGPERFQMGSVSEWVAAYSTCSVMVVRPRPN